MNGNSVWTRMSCEPPFLRRPEASEAIAADTVEILLTLLADGTTRTTSRSQPSLAAR